MANRWVRLEQIARRRFVASSGRQSIYCLVALQVIRQCLAASSPDHQKIKEIPPSQTTHQVGSPAGIARKKIQTERSC